MLTAGCRFTPLGYPDTVSREKLEGLFLHATVWPDTLEAGALATAEVELLLPDSTPFLADRVNWEVENVGVVELYPTRVPESKRIRGVTPGLSVVRVRATVHRIDGEPHNGNDVYEAELERPVFVRAPASQE